MKISVVIPLYSCSRFIKELTQRLEKTLVSITDEYEIIYVNDASPENDWEIVKEVSKANKRIKGINLSRNFGQHYAITAGLEYATGNWVVVMDGDLQDRPEEIVNLYNKSKEGFDIVLAKREDRQDRIFKKSFSYLFYKVFGYLTDTKYDHTIANFGFYSKKVIDSVLKMKDKSRVFPILLQWVGFDEISIKVKHDQRVKASSSYSYRKLFDLAFDIIISFSNKLLVLSIYLGMIISLVSMVVGVFFLYKYLRGEILVLGYTSLIISIWFLSGIIIFLIGILGIYIGRIFNATKDRPYYLIKQKINFYE